MHRHRRRQLLQVALALVGIGLLPGWEAPELGAEKVPRIGFLAVGSREGRAFVIEGFLQGLREHGETGSPAPCRAVESSEISAWTSTASAPRSSAPVTPSRNLMAERGERAPNPSTGSGSAQRPSNLWITRGSST